MDGTFFGEQRATVRDVAVSVLVTWIRNTCSQRTLCMGQDVSKEDEEEEEEDEEDG